MLGGLGHGNSRDKHVKKIDTEQIARLWRIYKCSPAFTASGAIITGRVLSMGIIYTRGEQIVDRRLYDHVQRVFVAFARDVMEHIWVTGFAAYTLSADKITGLPMPQVVPPAHLNYTITTNPVTFAQTLGIEEDSDSKTKSGPIFFVVDRLPDSDGAPNSNVRSVYDLHLFIKRIEETVILGERVRCQPPIVTSSKTDHQFDERDLVRFKVF